MRININMNLEKDFIRGLLYEYKTHSQIDSIEKIDDKDILNIMKSEDMIKYIYGSFPNWCKLKDY